MGNEGRGVKRRCRDGERKLRSFDLEKGRLRGDLAGPGGGLSSSRSGIKTRAVPGVPSVPNPCPISLPAGTKGLQPNGARGEHAPPGAAPTDGRASRGLWRAQPEVRVRGGTSLFPRLGPTPFPYNCHPPCHTLASPVGRSLPPSPPLVAAARGGGLSPVRARRDRNAATSAGARVWRDAKETLTLRINLYFNM